MSTDNINNSAQSNHLSPHSPKVSVIMNCYNGEKYLREAIDSVFVQTYKDWEIIFWDNASTDNSSSIACSYDYDSRLRYFHGKETVPLGAARNKAIEQAKGDLIAFLDCDDIWKPDKLEKQVALFIEKPEIAVVYSNCANIDENGNYLSNGLHHNQFYCGFVFNNLITRQFTPPWPTVVIKKNVFNITGPFVNYKCVEDIDILLKIAAHFPFAYVNEILALYRIHGNQLSKKYDIIRDEVLSICEYWNCQTDFQKPGMRRLIAKVKSRTYYISAVYALTLENNRLKAWENLTNSWKCSPSIRATLLFGLSVLKPKNVKLIMNLIKKLTGRGVIMLE